MHDREVIRRLVGNADVAPLRPGLDHRVYAVGDALIARFGAHAAREAALLEAVAPHLPLPVPVPVAVDEAAGCLVLPRIAGAPLLDVAPAARGRFAAELQSFAAGLHRLHPDIDLPHDDTPPAEHLDEARRSWPDVRGAVPQALWPAVEAVLAQPAPGPPAERCLIHGDLGAEHVFVDGDRITGVIDWGDAAVGDPALDHGRLLRDVGPGAVPGETGARVRGYALTSAIEDLEFAADRHDDRYRGNALTAIARLCGGR